MASFLKASARFVVSLTLAMPWWVKLDSEMYVGMAFPFTSGQGRLFKRRFAPSCGARLPPQTPNRRRHLFELGEVVLLGSLAWREPRRDRQRGSSAPSGVASQFESSPRSLIGALISRSYVTSWTTSRPSNGFLAGLEL